MILSLIIVCSTGFTLVNGATVYVPEAFSSIQEAVDAVSPGDTIQVYSGVYDETVYVDKYVTLQANSSDVIIDAGYNGTCITVNNTRIIIDGFHLRASSENVSNMGGVLLQNASGSIILDSQIYNCRNGIVSLFSENVTIQNVTIFDSLYGIDLQNSGSSYVGYCDISDPLYGVIVNQSPSSIIEYNNLNDLYTGVQVFRSSNLLIDENVISQISENGIWVGGTWDGSPFGYSTGNTISNNQILNASFGISTWYMEDSELSNNVFNHSKVVGVLLQHSPNNIISGDQIHNTQGDGISIYNSTGNIIQGVNSKNSLYAGIAASESELVIKNSNSFLNSVGIWLHQSTCELSGNQIHGNENIGVEFIDTHDSKIFENYIASNGDYGLILDESNSNNVSYNGIFDHEESVHLWRSNENLVQGNNVTDNVHGIVLLDNSNGNTICYNNLSNDNNVYVEDSTDNIWSLYGIGNYWSDYSGSDIDGDRIGETLLPHNDVDWYPVVYWHVIHREDVLISPKFGDYLNYSVVYHNETLSGEDYSLFSFTGYPNPYIANVSITTSGYTYSELYDVTNRSDNWGYHFPFWIESSLAIGSTFNLEYNETMVLYDETIIVGEYPVDCFVSSMAYPDINLTIWIDKLSGIVVKVYVSSDIDVTYTLSETNIESGYKPLIVAQSKGASGPDIQLEAMINDFSGYNWKLELENLTSDSLYGASMLITSISDLNQTYSQQEIDAIHDWLSQGGKSIWVTGDSDYGDDWLRQIQANNLLQSLGASLRIESCSVEDTIVNYGAGYRVRGITEYSDEITSTITENVDSLLFHSPGAITAYTDQYWELENEKPDDIYTIITTSSNGVIFDHNDPVPEIHSVEAIDAYVLMAVELMENQTQIYVSSESPYNHFKGFYKPELRDEIFSDDQEGALFVSQVLETALNRYLFEPQPQDIELVFNSGWNLVGFPFESQSVEALFGDSTINVDQIFTYSEEWKYWIPGASSTITKLGNGEGAWVYVNTPFNLTLSGFFSTPVEYQSGWNLITHGDINPVSVEDHLIEYDWESVFTYHNSQWYYALPSINGSLEYLETGKGYWISLNSIPSNYDPVDLTSYTTLDPKTVFSVNTTTVFWTHSNRTIAHSVYKYYGENYFTDFTHNLTFCIIEQDAGDENNRDMGALWGLTNSVPYEQDLSTMGFYAEQMDDRDDVYALYYLQRENETMTFLYGAGTMNVGTEYYATVSRTGTTTRLIIYTDDTRTTVFSDSGPIGCLDVTYSYVRLKTQKQRTDDLSDWNSGYITNYAIS